MGLVGFGLGFKIAGGWNGRFQVGGWAADGWVAYSRQRVGGILWTAELQMGPCTMSDGVSHSAGNHMHAQQQQTHPTFPAAQVHRNLGMAATIMGLVQVGCMAVCPALVMRR